jgi:hypothetical protein
VESKGVEIKKNREKEERNKVVCFMSWELCYKRYQEG